MTASIPLRIVHLSYSLGNRREQQEKADDSIRAFTACKALQRQGFPAAVFHWGRKTAGYPFLESVFHYTAWPADCQEKSAAHSAGGGHRCARAMKAFISGNKRGSSRKVGVLEKKGVEKRA